MREAVDEILQKFLGAVVADSTLVVDQIRLEGDVGLAAKEDHAKADHHRTEMLLRQGAADRAGRGAGDESGLAGPGVLTPRPRAPVDGVLENRGNGAVMFRSDNQDAVGAREFVLEAHHLGRKVAFIVLVVHRQVGDARKACVKFARRRARPAPGLWPSMKPPSFKPPRNASTRCADSSGDRELRNPTTGSACCALTPNGHTTAPPSSVTNSRRIIQSPRRRGRALSAA